MKHFLLFMLLSLFTVLAACGGDDTITLNGAEWGEKFFGEYCAAAADCGFIPQNEVGICVDAAVQVWCDQGLCSEQYTLDVNDMNACLNAVAESSCAAIDAIIQPVECNSLEDLSQASMPATMPHSWK